MQIRENNAFFKRHLNKSQSRAFDSSGESSAYKREAYATVTKHQHSNLTNIKSLKCSSVLDVNVNNFNNHKILSTIYLFEYKIITIY